MISVLKCFARLMASAVLPIAVGPAIMINVLLIINPGLEFNIHPFVNEFKNFVMNCENQSVRYGGVVDWLQKNTTTVPTPRSWELKKDQIVNTLYEWVCFFDESFTWDVPGGHSQVISFKEIK